MILLLLWQYNMTKAPVTDINKPKMSYSVNINNHKHNCYSGKKARGRVLKWGKKKKGPGMLQPE